MDKKHCFGILAHGNFEYLETLISSLVKLKGVIIIHIDKRVKKREFKQLSSKFHTDNNVVFIKNRIRAHRRYFSIIKATNNIIKQSIIYEWDFFHLISGSDVLVKDVAYFNDFFNEHHRLGFMDLKRFPLNTCTYIWSEPHPSIAQKINANFIKNDMLFFDKVPKNNYQNINTSYDEYTLVNRIHNKLFDYIYTKLQNSLRFHFLLPIFNLFLKISPQINFACGSAWFSLNRELVLLLDKGISNKAYNRKMKFVKFPSEIYYQTLIINLLTEEEIISKIVCSDLRYVNWNKQTNWRLDFLNNTDLKNASNKSLAVFARKVC